MRRHPTSKAKRAKAAARDPRPSGSAGAQRKVARRRPKTLVAGRSGPHPRFPKASSRADQPPTRKAPLSRHSGAREKKRPESAGRDKRTKTGTSPLRKPGDVRKQVASVFGRRPAPHPKPST